MSNPPFYSQEDEVIFSLITTLFIIFKFNLQIRLELILKQYVLEPKMK